MINKVKGHIGFHYLLTEIHLYIYFDSFGIEYIPLEVLTQIKDKSITLNIFRIQDNKSVMCWFYCITFTEYVLAGKNFVRIY